MIYDPRKDQSSSIVSGSNEPKFEPTALWRWSCGLRTWLLTPSVRHSGHGRLGFQVRHVNVTLTADLEAEASDVWTLYLVQPLAERTGIWWMMLARVQSLKWPGNVLWLKCATKWLCDALLFFLVHTILYFCFWLRSVLIAKSPRFCWISIPVGKSSSPRRVNKLRAKPRWTLTMIPEFSQLRVSGIFDLS